MAVMGTGLWGGLAGRNHNLPRLPPPWLTSQRDDNPSLDVTGLEPDPRITLLGRGHQVVKEAPGTRATDRGAARGWVYGLPSRAGTGCSSRCRWTGRRR